MTADQVSNGIIAVVLGLVVSVLLLAPVAAVQYRRDGRLGPGDLTVLVAAAVYGLSLWTYTLLPLPTSGDYTCTEAQLTPLASITPFLDELTSPRLLLHDPAFQQVVLNVLLFVPLGFFVRLVTGRGVLVTTALGLGISLAIETTQLTGVWWLWPCPFRLFDVDDLLVNTAGALVGGVLAWVLVRRGRRDERPLPTSVSVGRRVVAVVSDLIVMGVAGGAVAVAWNAWQRYGLDRSYDQMDRSYDTWITLLVPLVVEGVCVLLAGRTVGEWVVSVRTVARGPLPTPLARVVKLLLGVGGLLVLLHLPGAWSAWLLLGFVVVSVVALLPTREHRGLANLAAGLDYVVER